LAAIPVGDDLALIGSNAGSGKIPGWAFNLRAHPQAALTHNGRVVAVTAREANADEYETAFAAAIRLYSGYAGYRERADHTIPVFMLSNAAGPSQQQRDVE
jgi:deazaflavin-dependent oxidoreductase (nitroreductase family)